jgi:hypothetical protein
VAGSSDWAAEGPRLTTLDASQKCSARERGGGSERRDINKARRVSCAPTVVSSDVYESMEWLSGSGRHGSLRGKSDQQSDEQGSGGGQTCAGSCG